MTPMNHKRLLLHNCNGSTTKCPSCPLGLIPALLRDLMCSLPCDCNSMLMPNVMETGMFKNYVPFLC